MAIPRPVTSTTGAGAICPMVRYVRLLNPPTTRFTTFNLPVSKRSTSGSPQPHCPLDPSPRPLRTVESPINCGCRNRAMRSCRRSHRHQRNRVLLHRQSLRRQERRQRTVDAFQTRHHLGRGEVRAFRAAIPSSCFIRGATLQVATSAFLPTFFEECR